MYCINVLDVISFQLGTSGAELLTHFWQLGLNLTPDANLLRLDFLSKLRQRHESVEFREKGAASGSKT